MAHYALLDADTVVEVADLPASPGEVFHPELAPRWVPCAADTKPGWTRQGGVLAAPVPSLPDAIAAAKLRALRDLTQRIEAGMPWQDRVLQVDDAAQAHLTAAALMAQANALPAGFAWRMADNSMLPLNSADLITMAAAAGQRVAGLRARYWAAVDAASAATDVAAAEAVPQ